jgi:hypothetical protein
MAQYRYLFYDLMTNVATAELELTNVNFSKQLNSAGTFAGEILITDTSEVVQNILFSTRPGKTALYVERSDLANGIGPSLVWGGIIWQRAYDSTKQGITFTAREFESYFERVFIHAYNLTGNVNNTAATFSNVDQLLVAQTLISTAQSGNNLTNIGVQVVGAASNPVQPITRTYYDYEHKTVFQAVQDLSQADNGFDFNVSVYYDVNGVPRKLMNFGYPQLGVRYNAKDPNETVLQMPGNIVSYTYAEDSATQTNVAYTLGAGSNEAQIQGIAYGKSSGDNYPASWPALEEAYSFTDYTDTTLLLQLATGRIAAFDYPVVTMNVVATATQEPWIGTFDVADDVRVVIADDRFTTPLDFVYRLTALTVTPGENNAPELVTYSLTLPTNVY